MQTYLSNLIINTLVAAILIAIYTGLTDVTFAQLLEHWFAILWPPIAIMGISFFSPDPLG